MGGWAELLNILFAGAALGCVLWAVRLTLLHRRLRAGLLALLRGDFHQRLRRRQEDQEAVLIAYDQLAEELGARRAENAASSNPSSEIGPVLERLCEALRPPLTVMQAQAIELQERVGADETQQQSVQKILGQVNALLRLLQTSSDPGQLQKELSGLQRAQAAPGTAARPVILLVDDGSEAPELFQRIAEREHWMLEHLAGHILTNRVEELRPGWMVIDIGTAAGWRAIRDQNRVTDAIGVPLLLYVRDDSFTKARYWLVSAVWAWSLPSSLLRMHRLIEMEKAYSIQAGGDLVLLDDVVRIIEQERRKAQIQYDSTIGVPGRCCQLSIRALQQEPRTATTVWVVPQFLLENEADQLAVSSRALLEQDSLPAEAFDAEVVNAMKGNG